MGRGFRNLAKRAISPLISAVLLIAFAVTLGAIVMSWGQSFVEDNADEALIAGDLEVACQITTSLGVKTVAGNKRICYKNTSNTQGVLDFTLENKGSDLIEGVKVILIGENDSVETTDLQDFEISPGGINKGNATFNFTVFGGSVTQADFVPYVTIDSATGVQLCRNIKVEEDGIFECD